MRDRVGNALIRLGRHVRRTKFASGGMVSGPIKVSLSPGMTFVNPEDLKRAMNRAKGKPGR